jgi:hypothetical protein
MLNREDSVRNPKKELGILSWGIIHQCSDFASPWLVPDSVLPKIKKAEMGKCYHSFYSLAIVVYSMLPLKERPIYSIYFKYSSGENLVKL